LTKCKLIHRGLKIFSPVLYSIETNERYSIDITYPKVLITNFLIGGPGGFYFGGVYPHDEWTLGPFYSLEGLIIKPHHYNTVPTSLQYDGLSLLPSLTSDVVITRHDTTLLVRAQVRDVVT